MTLTDLALAADDAINQARLDNTIIDGSDEPDQVARLVTSLPKLLVDAWHKYVKSGALTVSAAFCHAKPKVSWKSTLLGKPTHGPELADLLFIFDVKNSGGTRIRRSLLIQAKKGDGAKCTLSDEGDLTQRYMYSDWPPMSLKGVPKSFAVTPTFVLKPVGADNQARYACFDSNSATTPAWTLEGSASTMPNTAGLTSFKDGGTVALTLNSSLGMGLAQLYNGTLGRQCDIPGDDWSELTGYLERYISKHVPYNKNKKTFPSVTVHPGISPLPLVAASSFFAAFPIAFPRHSATEHLLLGMNDWVHMNMVRPAGENGLFYDWPPYNTSPPEKPINLDSPGLGIIRVVIDEPLEGMQMHG